MLGKSPWERGGRPVLLGATPSAPPPRLRPRTSGSPEREEKGQTGRPAALRNCAPACLRAPRARTLCASARPACLRALRACTPRASARSACLRAPRACTPRASAHLRVCAPDVLPHVLPARPAACTRRLPAQRAAFVARDQHRVITTLRLSVRLRARFAISYLVSYLDRSVSDSGF